MPTLGVLPWIDDVELDAEDSLALRVAPWARARRSAARRRARRRGRALPAHLQLHRPRPARRRAGRRACASSPTPPALGRPDLVVLPGTKATVADLAWLRERGLDDAAPSHPTRPCSASAAATRCSARRSTTTSSRATASVAGLGLAARAARRSRPRRSRVASRARALGRAGGTATRSTTAGCTPSGGDAFVVLDGEPGADGVAARRGATAPPSTGCSRPTASAARSSAHGRGAGRASGSSPAPTSFAAVRDVADRPAGRRARGPPRPRRRDSTLVAEAARPARLLPGGPAVTLAEVLAAVSRPGVVPARPRPRPTATTGSRVPTSSSTDRATLERGRRRTEGRASAPTTSRWRRRCSSRPTRSGSPAWRSRAYALGLPVPRGRARGHARCGSTSPARRPSRTSIRTSTTLDAPAAGARAGRRAPRAARRRACTRRSRSGSGCSGATSRRRAPWCSARVESSGADVAAVRGAGRAVHRRRARLRRPRPVHASCVPATTRAGSGTVRAAASGSAPPSGQLCDNCSLARRGRAAGPAAEPSWRRRRDPLRHQRRHRGAGAAHRGRGACPDGFDHGARRAAVDRRRSSPTSTASAACSCASCAAAQRVAGRVRRAARPSASSGAIPFLAFGGEAVPDAELTRVSTVPSGIVTEAFAYLVNGGPENFEHLLRFVADTVLLEGYGFDASPRDPRRSACGAAPARRDASRPLVGVVFYRAHLVAGNTQFVTDLCDGGRGGRRRCPRGLVLLAARSGLGRGPRRARARPRRRRADHDGPRRRGHRRRRRDDRARRAGSTARRGTWARSPRSTSRSCRRRRRDASRAEWERRPQGLGPYDATVGHRHPGVRRPDHRPGVRVQRGRRRRRRAGAVGARLPHRARPRRPRRRASRCAYARLRRTPPADRRVAIVLSAYPTKRSRLGNAVGLDTPASAMALLDALARPGLLARRRPDRR